jgi:hypothetical protein
MPRQRVRSLGCAVPRRAHSGRRMPRASTWGGGALRVKMPSSHADLDLLRGQAGIEELCTRDVSVLAVCDPGDRRRWGHFCGYIPQK